MFFRPDGEPSYLPPDKLVKSIWNAPPFIPPPPPPQTYSKQQPPPQQQEQQQHHSHSHRQEEQQQQQQQQFQPREKTPNYNNRFEQQQQQHHHHHQQQRKQQQEEESYLREREAENPSRNTNNTNYDRLDPSHYDDEDYHDHTRVIFVSIALAVSRKTFLKGLENEFGINTSEEVDFCLRRANNSAFLHFRTESAVSRFVRKLDAVSPNGPCSAANGVHYNFKEVYKDEGDHWGEGRHVVFYRAEAKQPNLGAHRPEADKLLLDLIPASRRFHEDHAAEYQRTNVYKHISKAQFAELLFSVVEKRLNRDLKSVFPEHPGRNWDGDGMELMMSKAGSSSFLNKKTVIRAELKFKSVELSRRFKDLLDDAVVLFPFFDTCRVAAYFPEGRRRGKY